MEKEKKTALVLGGGGARGGYQIGVWQALREMGMTFDIVTGTSVGAINAAMVAQDAFDPAMKLWKELETEMVFDIDKEKYNDWDKLEIGGRPMDEVLAYLKELVVSGGAGSDGLYELLQTYVDEDKVRSSQMDMGLVVVSVPSMKPKLLYKDDIPRGKLRDYILASASAFPAIKRYDIDGKLYIDGSYYDVLPVEMAMKKGATDIIAVNLEGTGILRKNTINAAKKNSDSFLMIQSTWDLGSILAFDPDNTARIIRLGYLETMKAMGKYDGMCYTFEKGVFGKGEVKEVDALGKILGLDAAAVYDREAFDRAVKPKLLDAQIAFRKMERKILDKRDLSSFLGGKITDDLLIVLISESIKLKGEDSIFLTKTALSALRQQIFAAHYIMKKGWTIQED
ncbi:MAG: patatin-like phospholipase family protein [Anaerovoracaceae bacterium]|jgi:NTE family protein